MSSFTGALAAPRGSDAVGRLLGNYATWVNIWEDPQVEEHVKVLANEARCRSMVTGDTHFVVADLVSRNKVKKLIENTDSR